MAEDFEAFDPDVLRIERDVVGSSTFVGYAKSQTVTTANPVWLIKRVTVAGNQTEVLYASDLFDQVWDDRLSLFPDPPFSNNNSILFSGTNDRLEFLNHVNLLDFDGLPGTNVSFSAWVRTSKTGEQAIISKQSGTNGAGWRVTMQSNQSRFHFSSGGGGVRMELRTPTLSLADDNWHHIGWSLTDAVAPVAGKFVCVIDGVDRTGSVTINSDGFTTSAVNTDPPLIGLRAASALDYDGFMDEVAVYDTALSVADFQTIYASQTVIDLINVGPSPGNLLLWSRMGDNDAFPTITNLGTGGTELTMTMTDMKASDIVEEVV